MLKQLAIYSDNPALQADAKQLAESLHLPLLTFYDESYDYLLILTSDYLGLQKTQSKSHPVRVNFLDKKTSYRIERLSIKKEAIARALGLKKGTNPSIVDATGGLAGDSFIIASLGFHITLIERSPIVHALIHDGIQRANQDPNLQPTMSRLHLVHANAISWLSEVSHKPDIVYVDPMFPERKKSALPKQEMLIFHDIVGEDADAEALLNAALACAQKRVVVKRPRLASAITSSRSPSYSLKGNSCRFDIYLI